MEPLDDEAESDLRVKQQWVLKERQTVIIQCINVYYFLIKIKISQMCYLCYANTWLLFLFINTFPVIDVLSY